MATPAATPPSKTKQRRGRMRAQLPHCYHEGYLEKRSPNDRVSQRLWTCLCGNTLFFFNNSKDSNYVEKLELSGFVSLTDDNNRDRNLEARRLNLRLKDGEVKLIVPTLEARELWKGFIYAVAELSVPSSLNLLPGQLHLLREVVQKERERRKPLTIAQEPASNIYLSLLGDMPTCYRKVSRTEAMILLQRHPDCGNLLLRPGSDDSWLAMTTYQYLNGPVFRHYRVSRKHEGGFTIDLKTPVSCATLHDVVHYIVEETAGALKPFTLEETYEDCITFVQSNGENGETTLICATDSPCAKVPAPVLPPKPSNQLSAVCVPLIRSASPETQWDTDQNFYLNYNRKNQEESSSKSSDINSGVQPPTPPPKPVKKVELPYQSCLATNHSEGQSSWEHEEERTSKSCHPNSDVHPPSLPPKPGTEKAPEKVALMPPSLSSRSKVSSSDAKPVAVKTFLGGNPRLKELSEELKEIVGKRSANQL
ncbi:signal-transducing adaptor protein 1-like [Scleropages formosus]|uniref:Signal transducing adaptor family member 2b n=1 Tax=Scleropages formosus TaxID=113540 RepID=A0A8C9SVA3_SCLFO|nr:signal-transducing adaptor protein 1 [Scleropages formosus]XP_018583889.2 signal-transducing adaptor protein 1 [Scleropages formosus]